MTYGQTLIDEAAKVCGSRYALAKRLSVQESNLGEMARGKRPVPASLAARVAQIIGQDPKASALAALIEQEKNEVTRAELEKLFGIELPKDPVHQVCALC